jgi:hypothetical protein
MESHILNTRQLILRNCEACINIFEVKVIN